MFDISENKSLDKVATALFCPLSGLWSKLCKNALRCRSVRFLLSRYCLMSGFCPDFRRKNSSLSVCLIGQGRDRADRTFTVLVIRRFINSVLSKGIKPNYSVISAKKYLSDSFLFFGLVNVF